MIVVEMPTERHMSVCVILAHYVFHLLYAFFLFFFFFSFFFNFNFYFF